MVIEATVPVGELRCAVCGRALELAEEVVTVFMPSGENEVAVTGYCPEHLPPSES